MTLIQMSVVGSVAVLLIIFIRSVALYKISAKFFLALWCFALLRLLIPYTPVINVPVSLPVPQDISQIAGEGAGLAAENNNDSFSEPVTGVASDDAVPVIAIIWAVVSAALLAYFLLTHLNHSVFYRFAIPARHENVRRILADNKLRRRNIRVKISSQIHQPFTYGLFRPIIILPDTLDCDDALRLKYVLAHEIVHIRRCDVLWKALMILALCLHWFNPLVWVMFALVNRDLEISCDEAVLAEIEGSSKEYYAMTLLSFAHSNESMPALFSKFNSNAVEERLKAVMKIKKKSIVAVSVAAVCLAVVIAILSSSLSQAAPSDNTGLSDIPDSLDERIRSVIFSEGPHGSERLISVSENDKDSYTDAQWQAILDAVELNLVRWEEPGDTPESRLMDLSSGAGFVDAKFLGDVHFVSSTDTIKVTLADGAYTGYLRLCDANDESHVIQEAYLDADNNSAVFQDLEPSASFVLRTTEECEAVVFRITSE